MIKGIIFDIDGTLLNHEEALQRAIASLYSFTKTKIPQSTFDEFLLIWKTKTNQFMNDYLDGKISFEQQRILRVQSVFSKWDYQLSSAQAMDLFNRYLGKYEENWVLYEDVLSCLTMLEQFPLGIVSDGEGNQQRQKLAVTNIESFFKSIIISGEVGLRKPHPNLFKKCAIELDLSLEDLVYVGDQIETDALGAINSGMYGVLINRIGQVYEENKIKIITNLNQLLKIIELINSEKIL